MQETKISVFKSIFKTKDVPHTIPLKTIVGLIKTGGKQKQIISDIRSTNDKERRNELKKQLYAIVFAGEFAQRNSKSMIRHSGLMVVDFDGYPNDETMIEWREKLINNDHVILLFDSPSGNGHKAVIKVNPELTRHTHPLVYRRFSRELDCEYLDEVTNNVDRVCYFSYDPNIYVNYDAKMFDPSIESEGVDHHSNVKMLPVNDVNEKIRRIMNFKFEKSFIKGQRNNYILDVASMMCEYGVPQNECESYLANHVVNGDFKLHELKTTIRSAYSIRQFGTKWFEDYDRVNSIRNELKKSTPDEVAKKHNVDTSVIQAIKDDENDIQFWSVREMKNGDEKITIHGMEYKYFLEANGFSKYYPSGTQEAIFVKIESNVVEETSVQKIKDFVLTYLSERSLLNVWEYISKYQMLFSENYLSMLDTIELSMLKDTKDTSYFCFRDNIVRVTKDSVDVISYLDVDFFVWKSHIIDREFHITNDHSNDYKSFISNISSQKPLAMECAIGYLLSTYKSKMNNKAIILNDETISENPEGGTGKGLFVQGVRQLRKVSILDGKSHDDKKSFAYQTISQDTNVMVFDDVQKNFNFEHKFSLVTEGITLEQKNKNAIKLSVEESPKLLITTNYAIKGEGNSHDRRRHELEVAQYYNSDLTPMQEFGKALFDDWTDDEYNRFDNYMISCVQNYIANGLVKQKAKNIKLRKFQQETSAEFYEWISDQHNFKLNERHNKQQKYIEFVEEYQDYKKWLSRKRFAIWVQKYANFANLEYEQNISNGFRWFMIKSEEVESVDEIPF